MTGDDNDGDQWVRTLPPDGIFITGYAPTALITVAAVNAETQADSAEIIKFGAMLAGLDESLLMALSSENHPEQDRLLSEFNSELISKPFAATHAKAELENRIRKSVLRTQIILAIISAAVGIISALITISIWNIFIFDNNPPIPQLPSSSPQK